MITLDLSILSPCKNHYIFAMEFFRLCCYRRRIGSATLDVLDDLSKLVGQGGIFQLFCGKFLPKLVISFFDNFS